MTAASEIAKQALREGNLVPLATALTPAQEAEALALLNRFITSLLGLELGEFAFDWPVPPAATSPVRARFPVNPKSVDLPSDVWPYPPGNVRIIMSLTANTTIYMPQAPDDGARMLFVNIGEGVLFNLIVDGNGRLVNGAPTVTATPAVLNTQLWLYRADLSDWTAITPLVAADESPLPDVYDDLLMTGTFIRLAPRYGRTASAETVSTLKRLMTRLKAQYRQTTIMPSAVPQPFYRPAADTSRGSFGAEGSLF